MTRALLLPPLIALLIGWPLAQAQAQTVVPVEIGGDGDADACASLGRIVRLDPAGDNVLSVRAGPGTRQRELDRLNAAALVTVCDERGAWLGVVYAPPGAEIDCGLSSPQEMRLPYRGPCRSGWVHRRFVDIIAG